MNAESVSSLKPFVCGAAALALTAIFSWTFVESTSVVRWTTAQASVQIADAAVSAATHAAQASVAALVD
ncbi:MAG TPA: hypothetical protein VJ011_07660 [Steroidobacteraceae bacterium]|nr:hypothetical protein [Steroidobacteraceae bacterium]